GAAVGGTGVGARSRGVGARAARRRARRGDAAAVVTAARGEGEHHGNSEQEGDRLATHGERTYWASLSIQRHSPNRPGRGFCPATISSARSDTALRNSGWGVIQKRSSMIESC